MKNMMPIQRKLKLQQSILSTHYTTKQQTITYLELHILTIHFTAFFTPEKNKKETIKEEKPCKLTNLRTKTPVRTSNLNSKINLTPTYSYFEFHFSVTFSFNLFSIPIFNCYFSK